MRTIFLVLSIPGYEPSGSLYSLPANQTLGEALELTLALLARNGVPELGTVADYVLRDLYGQTLDRRLLIRQVPFPGCVIVLRRAAAAEAGAHPAAGDDSPAAESIAMKLMALREDGEDALLGKYARYIRQGFWRFEPTPITNIDVGMTYHVENGRAATQLLDALETKGLRCRARVVKADGSSSGMDAGLSPADDARALVIMISQSCRDEPWLAFDAGAAWAAGIPVVPVLVGDWTVEPPDILSPYQRISWAAQPDRVVDDLVELLSLTPWSAVGDEPPADDQTRTKPSPKTRRRPAPRRARTR